MSMPIYTETQKCPKCGSTDIVIKFFEGDTSSNPVKPERIKITCKNCEFTGDMSPLDTPSAP